MLDQFWVGGSKAESEPAASLGRSLSTAFMFGCQFSETGLFRTQKADGIMGLSANSLTLVPHLKQQQLIEKRLFALCFKKGGGRMTIGGVNSAPHQEPMKYVPLTKASGWFTVSLKSIEIGGETLRVSNSVYNSGKGVIVDSGTTDTYLPRKMASAFKNRWKAVTKRSYGNSKMTLTDEQFAALPTVTFVFKDGNGDDVPVHMRPDAYMEKVRNTYVPRVYLTEGSGAVLGANFMQDHDVLFDSDGKRLGFARSDCSYHADVSSPLAANASLGEAATADLESAQELLGGGGAVGSSRKSQQTSASVPSSSSSLGSESEGNPMGSDTTIAVAAMLMFAATVVLVRRSRRSNAEAAVAAGSTPSVDENGENLESSRLLGGREVL